MSAALISIASRGIRTLTRRPMASLWAALCGRRRAGRSGGHRSAARHVDAWSRDLRAQASMVVYLRRGATAERAAEVAGALRGVDGVEAAVVVSSVDAADRLRAAWERTTSCSRVWIRPCAPIEVHAGARHGGCHRGESAGHAELRCRRVDDVEVTRTTAPLGEALARLEQLAGVVRRSIGIAAALIVAAAVRLRLGDASNERAALEWLGASRWFVRAPALVAGSVLGVVGAGLALVAAAGLVHVFRVDVAPALGGATEVVTWPLARAAALVGGGAVLGLIGGALGAERAARG
jgi:cell division protein FtsX